jgi:TetR/AcrR family transcriptional repressor of nem operon
MRYSSKHKEDTGRNIIEAASRVFREQGFAGSGIDELAGAANVTSGAFYGHFRSKREAFGAIVAAALDRLKNGITRFKAVSPEWLCPFAQYYMSETHRKNVGGGCGLPGLTGDVARLDARLKATYERQILDVHKLIVSEPPFAGLPDADDRAWAMLALISGGLTMARAVNSAEAARNISGAIQRQVERLGRPIGAEPNADRG